MAYSLISALVLPKNATSGWETKDVSAVALNLLYAFYSRIILTLSNPYLDKNVYVDLADLQSKLGGYSGTIPQWLGMNGNITLPTIDSLPNAHIKYVNYSDGTHAAYKADVCKIGFKIPLNYPSELLPDLQISRPKYKTNLELIHTHCLATVNGYLHQTDYDGTYAYIKQGAETMRKSNLNTFGFISFLDIGAIKTLPIDSSKVYADQSNTDHALKNKMYLHLNTPTEGKTVLLSLGGYLILPEAHKFFQVSDHVFCLNTDAYPILERYFESRRYLNLDSLELDVTPSKPDTIYVAQFLSDETLLKYLALPQSFWIILDTPSIGFSRTYLKSGKLPGNFIAYSKPKTPLVVGFGRMPEYWSVHEDGQYSVNVNSSFLYSYDFQTNQEHLDLNINDAAVPMAPASFSEGYLMNLHN